MDLKKFSKKLLTLSDNIKEIEKVIIFYFIKQTECNYNNSTFFTKYFSEINFELVEQVNNYCIRNKINFDLYKLIEVFELLIPEKEKK